MTRLLRPLFASPVGTLSRVRGTWERFHPARSPRRSVESEPVELEHDLVFVSRLYVSVCVRLLVDDHDGIDENHSPVANDINMICGDGNAPRFPRSPYALPEAAVLANLPTTVKNSTLTCARLLLNARLRMSGGGGSDRGCWRGNEDFRERVDCHTASGQAR